MSINRSIRQIHRWLSVLFTVTVAATAIALSREDPAVWVSYVPLLPLALLFLTGLYLFVLPYINKPRGRHLDTE
jgi:hypothetical protein